MPDQNKETAPRDGGDPSNGALIALVNKMEQSDNLSIEEVKGLVREFLEGLENIAHVELSGDVSNLYLEMQKEHLLARLERVKYVVECLAGGESIKVGDKNEHYANSVTADPDGLRIAMSEGEAPGPIRLLIGLNLNALIAFPQGNLSVSEIDDNEFDLRDTSLRKAYCRHIHGEIGVNDIRYIVLRIPMRVFPEEMLVQGESRDARFVFRGAKLTPAASVPDHMDIAA